jgi:hypothetical protein
VREHFEHVFIPGSDAPLKRFLNQLNIFSSIVVTPIRPVQAIDRMKMRALTVRGCESWPEVQSGLMLAGASLT